MSFENQHPVAVHALRLAVSWSLSFQTGPMPFLPSLCCFPLCKEDCVKRETGCLEEHVRPPSCLFAITSFASLPRALSRGLEAATKHQLRVKLPRRECFVGVGLDGVHAASRRQARYPHVPGSRGGFSFVPSGSHCPFIRGAFSSLG